MTRCEKCGDVSNSQPGLRCGRLEEGWVEPCDGVYKETDFATIADLYDEDGWDDFYPGEERLTEIEEMFVEYFPNFDE